jgi:hypothetical protein
MAFLKYLMVYNKANLKSNEFKASRVLRKFRIGKNLGKFLPTWPLL